MTQTKIETFEDVEAALAEVERHHKELKKHCDYKVFDGLWSDPSFMSCVAGTGIQIAALLFDMAEFYGETLPKHLTGRVHEQTALPETQETVMPDVQTAQNGLGEPLVGSGQEEIR